MHQNYGGSRVSNLADEKRLDRVYNDVYFGNGKPGLTTRMQSVEERQDAMDERCDKSDKKFDRMQAMLWTMIVLLLTILGTTLAEMVKGHEQPRNPNTSYTY